MANILKHRKSENEERSSGPLTSLHQEVSKAMNDFYDLFESRQFGLKGFENLKISPALDIVEDENAFKIEAEMPGMGEEDITVSISDNMLTIEGEKSTSKKDEDKNYLSREIGYGHYERSISLPQSADTENAKASFKKGMLWVEIPKKSSSKNKKRQLKVEKKG